MALPATRLPLLLVFYFIHFLALSHGQASCDGINDLEPFSTVWDISLKTTVTQVATVAYPDPSATVNNPATSTPQVTAVYLAVNGKWPADPIVVQKCQQVTIRVRNNIEPVKVWPNDLTPGFAQEEVTLHFHGLTQKDGRVIMDGPEGLTQKSVHHPALSMVFLSNPSLVAFKEDESSHTVSWLTKKEPVSYRTVWFPLGVGFIQGLHTS